MTRQGEIHHKGDVAAGKSRCQLEWSRKTMDPPMVYPTGQKANLRRVLEVAKRQLLSNQLTTGTSKSQTEWISTHIS
jgi:hypothetical protein